MSESPLEVIEIVVAIFGILGGVWVIYWIITQVKEYYRKKKEEEKEIIDLINKIDALIKIESEKKRLKI